MAETIFISIFGITILVSNSYATKKIYLSKLSSNYKKTYHILMVWLMPFVWFYWNKNMFIRKTEVMTKDKRDKTLKSENSGFRESKAGFYS